MQVFKVLRKYKWDLGIIVVASVMTAGLGVFAHGTVKGYTHLVATIAPLVFAAAALCLMTLVGTAPQAKKAQLGMRLFTDVALLALIAPAVFLKVETFWAPMEWFRGTSPQEVTAMIASGKDWSGLRAWARLVTLSKEDKAIVASELVPLLTGDDEQARRAAELTMDVPLKKFSMTTLSAMIPELRAYLSSRANGTSASRSTVRAGDFAQRFIQNNAAALDKAFAKGKRELLPPNGLEALLLAMATDPSIGQAFLRELGAHGDQVEKPLAVAVLHLAAISG